MTDFVPTGSGELGGEALAPGTPLRSALVTGATGFIGSTLTRLLAESGVRVLALVRAGGGDRSRLLGVPGVELVETLSWEEADLRRALAPYEAEAVFHLAAHGVNGRDRDPGALLDGNVGLLVRLLECVAGWPLRRFVHTGSCFEYGEQTARECLSEDLPVRPLSLYAAAKCAATVYGTALAREKKIPFVTLRLFHTYGPGEAEYRLLPYLGDRLPRGVPVDLTGGEQVRDFVYVGDVASALVHAAVSPGVEPYATYNVCSGVPVRVRELIEMVGDTLGCSRDLLRWTRHPYRLDEPMRSVGDPRRFFAATGWRPTVSLHEGLQETFSTILMQR